jgi:hypothetical protein
MIRPAHFFLAMLLGFSALAQAPSETPAAVALRVRREDAEKRALFQSSDTLQMTLEADFSALNRDRDPNSTKTYPGVISVSDASGQSHQIPVQLSVRGHLRRQTCQLVPLRVAFSKEAAKGTVFEMRGSNLKLINHCENTSEGDQYILKENLAYRVANIVTPRMFRARLAHIVYLDSQKKKPIATRYGMFLEDDGDVARRLEGKIVDREFSFDRLHPVALLQMTLFEFMIGNTDYSIFGRHNVRIVEAESSGLIYPIPYDFDVSGLVNVPYARPDPRLHIQYLTERVYRGPCRTPAQLQPFLNIFRSKKADILAAVDSIPDLNDLSRKQTSAFLNSFFSLIDKPSSVKHEIVDHCLKAGN